MFVKVAENSIPLRPMGVVALNIPQGEDWDIFRTDSELSIDRLKIAKIDKSEDLNDYDIEAAIKEHPDHLFTKCLAIKQDEVNENGDCFSGPELKKAAPTFVGCPIFCNHQNDDIEKARGKVVHAWYDEEAGGIYVISMVDKVAYPQLARGIEEGYITGTSMGCQVSHSYCSICHNKAHTADEYCSHVKNMKTRKFSGKVKCAYHKSKTKGDAKLDDNCPVCGCTAGETKENHHKDELVFEHNVGLKFIENSWVVNPACKECGIRCILNVPELSKKVAAMQARVAKMANWIGGERLLKVAGKQEVDYLNRAMKMMEVVAKSMMDQKEQVSMEYVSDIVDVLASLQTATDELVEMGYAQLPSPTTLQNPEGLPDAVPTQGAPGQPQPQQAAPQPAAPQPSGAASSPVGDIGSVTKPSLSPTAAGKMKELLKEGSNFVKKLSEIGEIVDKQGEVHTSLKESEDTMSSNNTKIAAGVGLTNEHQHVTTEKQLADAKLNFHPRTEEAPTGITESKEQLGLSTEPVNDTSSKSPQVRDGSYAVVTTEGQLPEIDGPIARWNEYPEVTTEKQWTDFSKAVGAILSKDQSEHVTQSQLEDLRSHHRWVEPNFTTELQLKSDENWLNKDNAWLDKTASKAYAQRLVTSAIESLSSAIAYYHKTPSEIIKAVQYINSNPQNQIKAAFLTLVNGLPKNVRSRKAERERSVYFGKTASTSGAVDIVLACMGDNCLGLKAEDFVDAVRYVASDAARMEAVEEKAQAKMAESEQGEVIVDKFAAFGEAFNEIQKPSDGLYQIKASFEDINADPEDEQSFVAAAEQFARTKVAEKNVVLYSVEEGEAGQLFITLKESSKLTEDERTRLASISEASTIETRASAREEIVKESQFGGQLGGGMDPSAGGGQGATMPQPPAGGMDAQTPPVESLEGAPGEEPMGEEGGDEQAMPPGSICPVCGSEDVDIVEGKGKCNNCNSQFVFKVQVEVTRWTGVNDTSSEEEGGVGEDAPLGGDEGTQEGEGFAMPDDGATPNIPVAAMTKLTPKSLQKLAGRKFGSISPLTGTTNTFELGNGKHLCLDTGVTYEVLTAVDKNNVKNVWAEWRWTPKIAGSDCTSCRRAKSVWVAALKSAGLTDESFEKLSFLKKADTLIDLDSKGAFKAIKVASKNTSVVAEFQKAYKVAGKFPVESCREKVARRYGENAIALSGPCKGDKLADCVCNELKKAHVYNDGLAFKVAYAWKNRDSCLECMEDYVRFGYDLEKAATVCQHMKIRYASPEDMFAEELSDTTPPDGGDPNGGPGDGGGPGGPGGPGGDDFSDAPDFDNVDGGAGDAGGDLGGDLSSPDGLGGGDDTGLALDIDTAPGAGGGAEVSIEPGLGGGGDIGGGHGEVTIKLPLSALDAIEQAIDSAHGGQPGAEPHHDLSGVDPNKEVSVELPGEAADVMEEPIEQALDQEVGQGGEGDGGESGGDEAPDFGGESGSEEGGFGGGDEDNGSPTENKEPEVANENEQTNDADHFANIMRPMKPGRRMGLDVTAILKALKTAEEGKDVKYENAQDTVGKVQDGGTIGNEEKFTAEKPDVPVGGAKAEMGKTESHPPQPGVKVPQNGPKNKNETEQGYTADGANATGGDKGQGKTPLASSKSVKQNKIAEQKTAEEGKKVNPPKPTSEVTEVDYSSNKDHKNTPESLKRTPFEDKDSKEVNNIPEKGEGAFLGDEKNSIGDIPKADGKFAPSIPTGGGMNPDYDRNEKNKPEMTNDVRGIKANSAVAGKNDDKNLKAVEAEAIRIAGRMIEAKLIDASELMKKIAELKQYRLPQLADIEKAIFKSASKGLTTASGGIEQAAPVIEITASQRNADDDLKSVLMSLSSLHRRNLEASEMTDAKLRAEYNRR
jgi:hypothetical protein